MLQVLVTDDKQQVKTELFLHFMKLQTVQLKYFCTKFTSCAQNVHHRPKRICLDVCESR